MTLTPQFTHDEETRVADVRDRLRQRFPHLGADVVATAVDEAYHELDGATLRDFVPILVEKRARDILGQALR